MYLEEDCMEIHFEPLSTSWNEVFEGGCFLDDVYGSYLFL